MELKCAQLAQDRFARHRFNRTFMELKLLSSRKHTIEVVVLIAPLWN